MQRLPLFAAALVFSCGICFARFVPYPFLLFYSLGLFSLALSGVLIKKEKLFVILILISYFLLGSIFYSNAVKPATDYASLLNLAEGKKVFIKGIVATLPQQKRINAAVRTSFIFELKEIKVFNEWRRLSARILVSSFSPQEFSYADEAILGGGKVF